jgi:hypothetical protein
MHCVYLVYCMYFVLYCYLYLWSILVCISVVGASEHDITYSITVTV